MVLQCGGRFSDTLLTLATTWGYVTTHDAAPAHALLDRVVAILWRLTHPGC